MHLSITGDLGSGKSTVAKEICRALGYKYLSTGQLQRQLGLERGMDTLTFNKFINNNLEIDDYIDQKLKDINNQSEPYVLDSRLAWHFVTKSFKVYLMAIEEVAAQRVLQDNSRIGEPLSQDVKTKMAELQERQRIENNRFEINYGIKPSIFRDFDAVVDASTGTISEVTDLILRLYSKNMNQENAPKIWLSPYRIFPTKKLENSAGKLPEQDAIHLAEMVFDPAFPVPCVLSNKEFYAYDGNDRLAISLKHKLPFVPVSLIAKNEEEIRPSLPVADFVANTFRTEIAQEWEEKLGFRYFRYPV